MSLCILLGTGFIITILSTLPEGEMKGVVALSDRYVYEVADRENIEIGKVIRDLRREAGIRQKDLYEGLCTKEIYLRLENGDGLVEELLEERVLSRLHLQYRLFDAAVSEEDFWRKDCRFHIDRLIRTGHFREAGVKLEDYRRRVEKEQPLQRQYLLWKEAQVLEQNDREDAGWKYKEALELTMAVPELELRLQKTEVVSEEELGMYLGYRRCIAPLSLREYQQIIQKTEKAMLTEQIYHTCYFETAFFYAQLLYKQKEYEKCMALCERLLRQFGDAGKYFYMPRISSLRARIRMKLANTQEEYTNIRQELRMEYYTALSFGERATAEEIAVFCEEEYGWHIMNSAN